MPKTPDEKMEALDRSVRQYRALSIFLLVVLLVSKRHDIVSWIDRAGGWVEGVSQVSAEPVRHR